MILQNVKADVKIQLKRCILNSAFLHNGKLRLTVLRASKFIDWLILRISVINQEQQYQKKRTIGNRSASKESETVFSRLDPFVKARPQPLRS